MVEKKKAVILLTPGFPENEQDTTCMPFLQQYVLSFLKARPDVELHIVAFQYPFIKGHYKWHGVNVYSAGGKSSKFSRLFTWMRVLKEVRRISKQCEIAVIHTYWLTECTFLGQRMAKKYKAKHIAYAIGQDVLKSNRYISLLIFPNMLLVAMSESIANKFYEVTGQKISHIIPAGIDVVQVAKPDEPRTIDILGVGALTPLKNYSLFVEIIGALKIDFPNIKATIIGMGEQERLLKEKIQADRLQDTIQLLGEIPHNEVLAYMHKSRIFLHTSSYEGQSTVLMEALAMGLTAVCFDIGRMHSDKINVCSSKYEMIKKLSTLLPATLDHKPQILYSANDTVKDFIKLYGL